MTQGPTSTTSPVGERIDRAFARVVVTVWRRTPGPLRRRMPLSFVGFALINGFTFATDLALLALLHRGAGLSYPTAVSIGYAVAFALAFVLNRRFNFHADGPVAGQVSRWVLVVIVNYVGLVLALGSGLVAVGTPFVLARIVTAGAEAVWMYSTMRWWVFAAPRRRPAPAATATRSAAPGGR